MVISPNWLILETINTKTNQLIENSLLIGMFFTKINVDIKDNKYPPITPE